MKKSIAEIKPEDALPFLIRLRKFILGNKTPDNFTRWIFFLNLFCWVMLFFWTAISYFVLVSSNIIEKSKGFSVDKIIIKNGQNLGFDGKEFIQIIQHFYFYSLFIWIIILMGIVLLYRKSRSYPLFLLGGLILHFTYMFVVLGFQYFLEDITIFDKVLYGILFFSTLLHSFFLNKEQTEFSSNQEDETEKERQNQDNSF